MPTERVSIAIFSEIPLASPIISITADALDLTKTRQTLCLPAKIRLSLNRQHHLLHMGHQGWVWTIPRHMRLVMKQKNVILQSQKSP
jgi:hypothetical protein